MAEAAQVPSESVRRFGQRVARTTLVLGALVALAATLKASALAGLGVLLGTLLAWINFRWLEEAADGLARLAKAQPGPQRPQISQWTWAKFFARYALLALALYVTVSRSQVPIVSVLGGLLMLGAAAMAVGLYEVLVETR
ncbi:MAG TPA: ATP synthase subunit I [Candidatus Acidoferrales bacterium]|nr:ATP synthase subunit I [Candidatus Acidoferrales bacterium]